MDQFEYIPGTVGLEEVVEQSKNDVSKVFILVFPVSGKEIVQYKGAGYVFPSKSTWFEPKVRSGMVVKSLV